MKSRIATGIALLALFVSTPLVHASAQDKMQNDKMSMDKMSMQNDKMATDKALMGLSKADKSYMMAHLSKMSEADRMDTTMKFTNLSVDGRKSAVMAMRNDKMSNKMGGKMSGDKMHGGMMKDKMHDGKMADDTMMHKEMMTGKTTYKP